MDGFSMNQEVLLFNLIYVGLFTQLSPRLSVICFQLVANVFMCLFNNVLPIWLLF